MLLLPTSVLHPSPRKSLAEEELRQKLKIEEGGKKEQGRKGGRLEGLGKSRMARVEKFVLLVDSLFEVPKSKLGSLDRDIIAWFRENYGILVTNEHKYGKAFSFGMLQELEEILQKEQPCCVIIISTGNDFFPANGFTYSEDMKEDMRFAIRRYKLLLSGIPHVIIFGGPASLWDLEDDYELACRRVVTDLQSEGLNGEWGGWLMKDDLKKEFFKKWHFRPCHRAEAVKFMKKLVKQCVQKAQPRQPPPPPYPPPDKISRTCKAFDAFKHYKAEAEGYLTVKPGDVIDIRFTDAHSPERGVPGCQHPWYIFGRCVAMNTEGWFPKTVLSKKSRIFCYRAECHYTAEGGVYLDMQRGDIIEIKEEHVYGEEGGASSKYAHYVFGSCRGRSGWIPEEFLGPELVAVFVEFLHGA